VFVTAFIYYEMKKVIFQLYNLCGLARWRRAPGRCGFMLSRARTTAL